MKIYVLGSNSFMEEMVQVRNELCKIGFDAWIHPHYDALVRGEMPEQIERIKNGEGAAVKREHNYFHEHYEHILQSDAIFVVNNEKRGIKNYIGGNVLIEMGQAYVHHKKIFLLNDTPREMPYIDEIVAMDPICLHGDLNTMNIS